MYCEIKLSCSKKKKIKNAFSVPFPRKKNRTTPLECETNTIIGYKSNIQHLYQNITFVKGSWKSPSRIKNILAQF